MSRGQRAAHLITSPPGCALGFFPEDQCTVLVITHALLICGRMVLD